MELMKEDDFSNWYHRIIEEAELIDMRYPVKGMLIYRRWGLYIIREMQRYLEKELEKAGHEPVLFPVLIPDNVLGKETDHIAGFEEQVFWVTHAGKNPLDRRLALRPTSETPMYESFSLWIRAHSDLPLKVHQSVAVYRYETKHTRPLIRGREFLWNEGHAAHASGAEAEKNVEDIKAIYANLIGDLLCLPHAIDRRPDWDKFPGAVDTFAFDTIMPDGRTLQIATVHNLGQNFSKVFNIQYESAEGKKEYAWQSSYGPSFGRLLAALVSVHGDKKGLVLPPKLAPVQAVVIPVLFKKTEDLNPKIIKYAEEIAEKLLAIGVRTETDFGEQHPGEKYYKWEMKGVPVRIEAGPRDLKARKLVYVRRDTGEKTETGFDELGNINALFDDITKNLRRKAEERFKEGLSKTSDLRGFTESLGKGIVSAGWCGSRECATKIEESGCILSVLEGPAECVVCGKAGREIKAAKTY